MGYKDDSSMKSVLDMHELAMQDHFFWLQYNFAVRFGDDSATDAYKYERDNQIGYGYSCIFDTGTTLAYVPSTLWEGFIDKLTEKASGAVI